MFLKIHFYINYIKNNSNTYIYLVIISKLKMGDAPYTQKLLHDTLFDVKFLAKRLYKVLGFKNPNWAYTLISTVKRTGQYYIGQRADKNNKVNALILYALGADTQHPEVTALTKSGYYPPQNGIPCQEMEKMWEALRNPNQADPDILKRLELDEKLLVLDSRGVSSINDMVDHLISQGRLKSKG
jgi:hypothetical protein